MNSQLLGRSLGTITPSHFSSFQTQQLIYNIEPAPGIRFASRKASQSNNILTLAEETSAHKTGVKCLAIDEFEGRYMVSAGADPSLHLWDLESRGAELDHTHRPRASINKSSHADAHTHSITSLSIYPFDPVPANIFTTSYDQTLKLSALGPTAIEPVHTFKLNCTPYAHAFSSKPHSTLLIAVGTSENAVRLVDLRSGLATQGLPGHTGPVLSVDWAPHRPYLLASGSVDHRVIIFDVRRGGFNSAIASFDMDDAVGLVPPDSTSPASRPAYSKQARAHNGAVTGVRWTSTGSHLVTSGQDSRIRVWDTSTGANTLVHFGPRVRNAVSAQLAERPPLLIPKSFTLPGYESFIWPNFTNGGDKGDMFLFEMADGALVKRLHVPGLVGTLHSQGRPGAITAGSAGRINDLAWRGNGGNGASGQGLELFSAHGDGTIRAWVSSQSDAEPSEEEEDRKRKRDVLDDMYKSFAAPNVPFGKIPAATEL